MNINQFGQMLGKKLNSDEIKAYQIQNLVLGSLINNAVFEDEFNQNKFLIDEIVIAKETKERIPQIYDENNKLNEFALNSFLNQQGLKIDDLVDIIEFETKARIFEDLFFQINLPKKINYKINQQRAHKREIEFIKINLDEISINDFSDKKILKEDQSVIEFYNENIDKYMTEETRDIAYIIVNKDDFIKQLKPSLSQIKKYYVENKEIYQVPEKRDFIQFNFKSKNEANNFLKSIENLNKEKIVKYAENNNIRFSNFNNLSKNEVLEELSNEIFKLNINQVSEIIETTLAHHVVILNNINLKRQLNFDQVTDDIETKLLNVELNNHTNEIKNNLSNDILEGLSIANLSNKYNLKINHLKNISNNQEKENSLIENDIINKAFITSKDFVSDVIDYNEDIFYIVNVDNIYYPKEIEYDLIYDQVIEEWLLNQKKEFFKKEFNNYNDYIKQLSLKYSKKTNVIKINKNDPDLPIEFISDIFKGKINNQILHFEKNIAYIGKIQSIIFNHNKEVTENVVSLNVDLKNAFGNEIIKNKKISTNDALLNALINKY